MAPAHFAFSIKVHRSITHYSKLGERGKALWERFTEPLKPIKHKIVFWLFQMPPSFSATNSNLGRLKDFFESFTEKGLVLEFRDPGWWGLRDKVLAMDLIFCSVDAPGLPRDIVCSKSAVYLRLHGRQNWYSYVYLEGELDHFASLIQACDSELKAVYLNNKHGMLENGLYLLDRLGITRSQQGAR